MTQCAIYGLASGEDGKVRYVGQTTAPVERRRYEHIWLARRGSQTRVSKWIRSVRRAGYSIDIFIIEKDAVLHASEKRLIAWYRRHGARLTNLTDGGEGTIGWSGGRGRKRPDLAARNRAGRGRSGRPISDEVRAKISAALKGRKRPDVAARNRLNKGKPGWPHTEASRAKIGQAHKGKVVSAETRAKLSQNKKECWRQKKASGEAYWSNGHWSAGNG